MFQEPFEVRTLRSEPPKKKKVRCLLEDKCESVAPKPMTAKKKAKIIKKNTTNKNAPICLSFIKINTVSIIDV